MNLINKKQRTYFFSILIISIFFIGCSNSKYRNISRDRVYNPSRTILLDNTKPFIPYDSIKNKSINYLKLDKEYVTIKDIKNDSPIVDPIKTKPEVNTPNYNDSSQNKEPNDSSLVNVQSETKKAERLVNIEYGFCMAACIALLLALISIIPLIAFSIEIFLDLCIVLVCLFIITSTVFGVIAFAKMKLLELELKNGKKLLKSFIINLLLIVLPIISLILAQLFLY